MGTWQMPLKVPPARATLTSRTAAGAASLTRWGMTSGLKSHLIYLCILQVQNPEQSKHGVREGYKISLILLSTGIRLLGIYSAPGIALMLSL